MKRISSRKTIRLIMLGIVILILITCIILYFFNPFGGNENSNYIAILAVIASLIGTIFIGVELMKSQIGSCCTTLIDLNNYFYQTPQLMEVYNIMEENYLHCTDISLYHPVFNEGSVDAYATFFENIYLMVKNGIAKMSDIDDLFGYRFFLFMHDPYIQDNYILPVSSSYAQVFLLYNIWIQYRERGNKKHGTNRHIVRSAFRFSPEFLKNKAYLMDKGMVRRKLDDYVSKDKSFHLEILSPKYIRNILDVQRESTESMTDKESEWYYPSTRTELVDSIHQDIIIGSFFNDELVGFCLLVVNRKDPRNVCGALSENKIRYCDSISVDAVCVKPNYRGYGLQKIMIQDAIKAFEATGLKCQYILSLVHQDNSYSLSNFLSLGFIEGHKDVPYHGLTRTLVYRKLK